MAGGTSSLARAALAILLCLAAARVDGAIAKAGLAPPKQQPSVPPMISASLWQAPVMALTYPIDTIKTRLQIPFGAPSAYQKSAAAFGVRRLNALQPPFWPGVVAACANTFPTFCIVYSTFEACREHLDNKFPEHNKALIDTASVVAGSVAGSLWSTPCEVMKCTFQSGMYTSSLRGAISAVHRESGVLGFYQGYTAQLARDLPLYGVLLGSYEALRDKYKEKFLEVKDKRGKKTLKREMGPREDALVGAVAGAISGAVTNPFDVVRTQSTMRTWGGRPWWSAANSAALMPRIFAEQGWRGLVAGMPERCLYTGLGAAAFFVAYEKLLARELEAKKPKKK